MQMYCSKICLDFSWPYSFLLQNGFDSPLKTLPVKTSKLLTDMQIFLLAACFWYTSAYSDIKLNLIENILFQRPFQWIFYPFPSKPL